MIEFLAELLSKKSRTEPLGKAGTFFFKLMLVLAALLVIGMVVLKFI
jgi:hypothetical protein